MNRINLKTQTNGLRGTNARRNILVAFVLLLTMGLFAGCGEKRTAKRLVTDYLENHLNEKDYDMLDCSAVDSTTRVTPQQLQVLQRQSLKGLRNDGKWAAATPVLKYVNVVYTQGNDTMRQTFYLDRALTGVVAVKE